MKGLYLSIKIIILSSLTSSAFIAQLNKRYYTSQKDHEELLEATSRRLVRKNMQLMQKKDIGRDSNAYDITLNNDINLIKSVISYNNPIEKAISFLKVLWQFTRPHTIVGSGISVIALYAFGTPIYMWGSIKFFKSLGRCLLPALLMNVFITGQCYYDNVKYKLL